MAETIALPRRSRFVDAGNRILPLLWRAGLQPEPILDVPRLLERASAETGLTDFGDVWFLRPLAVLVDAIRDEARLNAVGLFAAHGQFHKTLRERLWTEHWFARHPEIADRKLPGPIVVVGPMRSGTTRLHRLLACDDRFAHVRFFETACPAPPPSFRRGGPDPRERYARRLLMAVHRLNPGTAAIHPTALHAPEEELGLLVASMWGMKHEAQWHVPAFARWSMGQDATPAYRHMARLLQLVGWLRGDDDAKPWVLKTPQHMLDLPALLTVFPDARIVFTHRAPRAVVGSSCSLSYNQMIIYSDHVDPDRVGRSWLDKTALQIDRMRHARVSMPENRRIDVLYRDMDEDWRGVMARIYAFLGVDMAPAEPAMAHYQESSAQQRALYPHRYDVAQFGLTNTQIDARFADYSASFDLGSQPDVHVREPRLQVPEFLPGPERAHAFARVWDSD